MATVLQSHLAQVVTMMAVAPPAPRWWNARTSLEMPRAMRDLALIRVVRDVAKARGIKPADIRPRLIEAGDRGEALRNNEVASATDRAIVMDIQARMYDEQQAYANEIERAAEAAWRARWAIDMVSSALDAINAGSAPAPAPSPAGAQK